MERIYVPVSKDSASSSDDECTHERLHWSASKDHEFRCHDCGEWTGCPHTSWRWNDPKTHKVCNWCGHQWADPDEDCAHVAWEVKSEYATATGWYEYRKCTDCGVEWAEPVSTPAQDEIDADGAQPATQDQVPSNMLLAVEYSIGHMNLTVMVSPQANIVAIDGDLRISHNTPIHGIVGVRPVYVPDPAGEEQST